MVLGNNTSNQYISSKLSPDNVNFSTDTAFFKYTSGNSNIVSFNDPDRKNYMTINGTGHTTVTVEHLIYGLTATADVIIYDATDYRTDFDENNVMYIVLGSKYMEIPSDQMCIRDRFYTRPRNFYIGCTGKNATLSWNDDGKQSRIIDIDLNIAHIAKSFSV